MPDLCPYCNQPMGDLAEPDSEKMRARWQGHEAGRGGKLIERGSLETTKHLLPEWESGWRIGDRAAALAVMLAKPP